MMPAECVGIDYALRLHQAALEVRSRAFRHGTVTIKIGKIKSIELLREGTMAPALLSGIAPSLGTVLGLGNDELIGILRTGFHTSSQFLALGVGAICLIVLAARFVFATLISKPVGTSPIIHCPETDSQSRGLMREVLY